MPTNYGGITARTTNRVDIGSNAEKTETYLKLPTGKVGEDFRNWISSPLETLKAKASPIVRPLLETLTNDKGFGRKVYKPEDTQTPEGVAKAIGNIAWNFIKAQGPSDEISTAKDLLTGQSGTRKSIEEAKLVGSLLGITPSMGNKGGPAAGEANAIVDRYKDDKSEAMPDINRQLDIAKAARDSGDLTGYQEHFANARAIADQIKMTPQEFKSAVRSSESPGLSRGLFKDAIQHATPEERERLEQRLSR